MKTIKKTKKNQEVLEMKGKFIPVDTRPLDSKHRITLGGRLHKLLTSKMKIDSYKVFVGVNNLMQQEGKTVSK